jgi:hypothetical protein
MSDAYVRLAPDSTGAKVDTTELTVGVNTVERQRVHIAGSYSAGLAEVFPAGFLRVSDEPRQTFYDPFDSTLDTITRWLPVVAARRRCRGSCVRRAHDGHWHVRKRLLAD